MTDRIVLGVLMGLAVLSLVVVSLARRRLAMRQTIRLAIVWLGIFLVATLAATIGMHI